MQGFKDQQDHQAEEETKGQNHESEMECGGDNEEMVEMWDRWMEARRGEPTKEEEEPTSEWNSIRAMRKELAWVACEMDSVRRGKGMTKRRGHRQRVLALRLGKRKRRRGGRGMERGELKQIKENLRARLQVKLSKDRKRKIREAEIKARAEFRVRGPRSLRTHRDKPVDGDGDQAGVREIADFWGGIWGGGERPL